MRLLLVGPLLLAACLVPSRDATTVASPLVAVRQPPAAPGPGKPPLLVLLHGLGGDERDLAWLAGHLDRRFAVASLRAPYEARPGRAWFGVRFRPGGEPIVAFDQAEASRLALLQAIDAEVSAAAADPDRVFLAGFSQGGIMALSALVTAPEKLAGVIALSARMVPEIRSRAAPPERLRGRPVLLLHGTRDEVIPVRQARDTRALLESLGLDLTYRELPIGHAIPPEAVAEVAAWLRARLPAR